MTFVFDPEARDEFLDAVRHYEFAREGLGEEFRLEILRLISEAIEHPKRWPRMSRRARRHRSKRFPYGVIYDEILDGIRILAIAHLARRPGYWRNRLKR